MILIIVILLISAHSKCFLESPRLGSEINSFLRLKHNISDDNFSPSS